MEPLQQIENLLNLKIGLSTETIGQSAILSAVHTRMDEISVNSINEYANILTTSIEELTALTEECVVPETWFFRDGEPFEYLKSQIPLLTKKHQKLNILSMPCSTGEEPYSIAITLLEANLTPEQFSITAVDISEVALEAAHKAIYTEYSFRGVQDRHIIEKYFVHRDDHYGLKDCVKQQVNFKQLNIIEVDKNCLYQHYHIVFCRNLLIYFDQNQKKTTYRNIHNMMHNGGLLIMGHAESATTPEPLFKSNNVERTFSFIRREPGEYERELSAKSTKKLSASATKNKKRPDTNLHKEAINRRFVSKVKVKLKSKREDNLNKQDNDPIIAIQNARSLADQGKFELATEICNQYTNNHEVGDDAWYLLGLINDGEGNTSYSEECFRKAIYLNPHHYEALVNLSLLLKTSGNEIAAKQFMQRANRVKGTNSESRSADQS